VEGDATGTGPPIAQGCPVRRSALLGVSTIVNPVD